MKESNVPEKNSTHRREKQVVHRGNLEKKLSL
jgi:hypothetical protein